MVRRIQNTGGVGSILTAKGGGAGGAPASFVGIEADTGAFSSSAINVPIPAGTADGDLMLAFVISNGAPCHMPAGWGTIGSDLNVNAVIFAKIAASEGATVSITPSGSTIKDVLIATYRLGKARDLRLDQLPLLITASSPANAPSLTPHRNGTLLVFTAAQNGVTITTPAGMTMRAHFNGSNRRMGLYDQQVSKGISAVKSVAWTGGSPAYLTSILL